MFYPFLFMPIFRLQQWTYPVSNRCPTSQHLEKLSSGTLKVSSSVSYRNYGEPFLTISTEDFYSAQLMIEMEAGIIILLSSR